MKKLLKIFFLFSVLALCSCNSNKNKEFYTTNKSENGFYLISSPVPKKVVDYAKEIFVKEKLTGIAIKDVNNLELSEPYSIKENIFSFFILQNGKRVGTLKITENNGKLKYQISQGYLEEELNNIISKDGIYELSFEEKEKGGRPTPIFKKRDDVPKDKVIYNIKNSLKKIQN